MARKFRNMSGEEDPLSGYKTYYLRILADDAVFYKFGRCAGSIKQRFSKERPDLEIEVLRMWHHKSHRSAEKHEIHLFESFPGDRPYIGRCGPFRFGGNTETFSHDVMGGEPAPHSYWVRMYSERQGCVHTRAYSGSDPRTPYRHLIGKFRIWILLMDLEVKVRASLYKLLILAVQMR